MRQRAVSCVQTSQLSFTILAKPQNIIPASDPKHDKKSRKINQKLVKNDVFDQNGGRHELRHEKMMHFYPGDVDFRATATEIIKNLSKIMVLTKTAAAISSGTKK